MSCDNKPSNITLTQAQAQAQAQANEQLIRSKNLADVKKAIELGADVNLRFKLSHRETLSPRRVLPRKIMKIFSDTGEELSVEELTDMEELTDTEEPEQATLYSVLCLDWTTDIVQTLLEAGTDPNGIRCGSSEIGLDYDMENQFIREVGTLFCPISTTAIYYYILRGEYDSVLLLEQHGGLNLAKLFDYAMIMIHRVTVMKPGHHNILDHLIDLGLTLVSGGPYSLALAALINRNSEMFVKLVEIYKVRNVTLYASDAFDEIFRMGTHTGVFTMIEECADLLIRCGINPNAPNSGGWMLSEILESYKIKIEVNNDDDDNHPVNSVIRQIQSRLSYDRDLLVESIILKAGQNARVSLAMFLKIMGLTVDTSVDSLKQWIDKQEKMRCLEAFNRFLSMHTTAQYNLYTRKGDRYAVCSCLKLSDICPDHEYHLSIEPYRKREFEKIGKDHPEGALVHAVLGEYDSMLFQFDLATFLNDQPDLAPLEALHNNFHQRHLLERSSPLPYYIYEPIKLSDEMLCLLLIYATKIGYVDVLKFLMVHGLTAEFINNLSRSQMECSINMGSRFLTDRFTDYLKPEIVGDNPTTDLVFLIAVSNENLIDNGSLYNVLDFLKTNAGLTITDQSHVDNMIYTGSLDIVKYLHANFSLKVASLDSEKVLANRYWGPQILEYLYSSGLVKKWYTTNDEHGDENEDECENKNENKKPLDISLCDPCPVCGSHFLLQDRDGAIVPTVLYNTTCGHMSHRRCLLDFFKHTDIPKCVVCSKMISSEPDKIIIPSNYTRDEAIVRLRASNSFLLAEKL